MTYVGQEITVHHIKPGSAWASPDDQTVVLCDGAAAPTTEKYECTCMVDWGVNHYNKGRLPLTVPAGTSFADVVIKATNDCRRAYPANGFGASDNEMNAKNCKRVN